MNRKPGRRSVSIGTIVMLVLAAVVLIGMLRVLGSLRSGVDVNKLQTSTVLELSNDLSVGRMDIPDGLALTAAHQQAIATATPTATPAPTATPTPTAAPTATPYAGGSFTLTAGGNFYIEYGVRQSCYYRDSKKYDLAELTELISADITGDLRIATLENLVMPDEKYTNLIAPASAMSMLRSAGFNTVAIGFSRILEKGMNGVQQTIDAAKFDGLRAIGAYGSETDRAIASHIIQVNDVKVALLHYLADANLTQTAKKNRNTIGAWSQPLISEAADDIATARQLGAQVVIVSLNWGKKDANAPTKKQQEIAQGLADAGADLILGTGAQNLQSIAWLEGHRADGQTVRTLCCYDLGSLICDSRTNNGVTGLLLHAAVSVDAAGHVTISNTSYTPTYIWHYEQDKAERFRIVNSSLAGPGGMDTVQERCKNNAFERVPKKIANEDIVLQTR